MLASVRHLAIGSASLLLRASFTTVVGEAGVAGLALIALAVALAGGPEWLVFAFALVLLLSLIHI